MILKMLMLITRKALTRITMRMGMTRVATDKES